MKSLIVLIVLAFSFGSANAQKLFSKEWKQWQMGKDSAAIAKKENEVYLKLKKKEKAAYYYNFETVEEGLIISGNLLKKSANCQYAAIATMLGGAGLAIAAPYQDKVSSRNIFLISGGGLALTGLIFQIVAIDYKFKSGRALEVAAGKIALRF